MAKAAALSPKSRKRKQQEEVHKTAEPIDSDSRATSLDSDDGVQENNGKRFASQGFDRIHPRPMLDISTSTSETEMWLLQVPYECELRGDAELRVEQGEDGTVRMVCTTDDGVCCTSLSGPVVEYGQQLYATPAFDHPGEPARPVDRVVAFMDAAYARYLPAAAVAAAAGMDTPAGAADGGTRAAAQADSPSRLAGTPGSHKKEKRKKKKERHHGSEEEQQGGRHASPGADSPDSQDKPVKKAKKEKKHKKQKKHKGEK